ncbi:MAG: hypothetical protein MMC33_005333 [Icmadophila ericetorum]|nr:hypothetical protein [Icmadophila ericetorum]
MEPRFEPLTSRDSIRLLKIYPGCRDDPISCSIDNIELKNLPSYAALSYTWDAARNEDLEASLGQDNVPIHTEIRLNEETIRVTQNLHDALLQLRNDAYTEYLWVDAICIDQRDDVERASQIMLMGEIYSAAKEVIVWLGLESASLNGFRWVHEDFAMKLAEKIGSKVVDGMEPWETTLSHESFVGYQFEEHKSKWEDYCRFYNEHRWFGRAWIIQELSLAREITVRVGSATLDWSLMVFVGRWVTQSRLSDALRNVRNIKTLGSEVSLLDSLLRDCQSGGPFALSEALTKVKEEMVEVHGPMSAFQGCLAFMMDTIIQFRQSKATDPRDKIFCAFGFFQRFYNLIIPREQGISPIDYFQNYEEINPIYPSYKATTEEVYTSFTAFLIQKLPYLTILSDVEDRTRRTLANLPSWVPDYSSPVGSRSFAWGFRHCDYNVWLQDPLQWQPSLRIISGTVLKVRGIRLDTIESPCHDMASCKTTEQKSWLNNICLLLGSYLEVLNSLKVQYRNSQSRLEALWRTVIADQFNEAPATADGGVSFHHWVWWIAVLTAKMTPDPRTVPGYLNLVKQLKWFGVDTARREPIFVTKDTSGREYRVEQGTDCVISPYTLPSIDEVVEGIRMLSRERTTEEAELLKKIETRFSQFDVAMGYVHMDRRLYKTVGGLLGLGPLSIYAGDEIWLIRDMRIPAVLRPSTTSDEYQFVGDTYLHGFMHGEVSQMSELLDTTSEVKII